MAEPPENEQEVSSGQAEQAAIEQTEFAGFQLEIRDLPEERTARHARALLREVLRNAGVDENDVDEAELVVGELAANAVSYAGGPYEIRFVLVGGRPAWCEVVDGGTDLAGIPEIFEKLKGAEAAEFAPAEVPREHGHGLAIVHRLSGGLCKAYPTVVSSARRPGKAVAFALPSNGLL
ncbi:ATP-binding protein [Actinomadura sp. WMMA1423]|uniref:ATP-binding protein n=1 Tax=Actinomadura sp. WMMA1423 TaxID=2591108 RepID=UPI00143D6035|nr:ATP-binding protein [Actinomadura sp. WMMA1423]